MSEEGPWRKSSFLDINRIKKCQTRPWRLQVFTSSIHSGSQKSCINSCGWKKHMFVKNEVEKSININVRRLDLIRQAMTMWAKRKEKESDKEEEHNVKRIKSRHILNISPELLMDFAWMDPSCLDYTLGLASCGLLKSEQCQMFPTRSWPSPSFSMCHRLSEFTVVSSSISHPFVVYTTTSLERQDYSSFQSNMKYHWYELYRTLNISQPIFCKYSILHSTHHGQDKE